MVRWFLWFLWHMLLGRLTTHLFNLTLGRVTGQRWHVHAWRAAEPVGWVPDETPMTIDFVCCRCGSTALWRQKAIEKMRAEAAVTHYANQVVCEYVKLRDSTKKLED